VAIDSSRLQDLTFQRLTQARERLCIDHIVRSQPAAPGLIDAETNVTECIHRVRVSRDGDLDAFAFGHVGMHVVQIETIWFGIDLKVTIELAALLK
jgi:hypothetical protein